MSRADEFGQAVGAPVPTAAPVEAGASGVPASADVSHVPFFSVSMTLFRSDYDGVVMSLSEVREWLKSVRGRRKTVKAKVFSWVLEVEVEVEGEGRLWIVMAKYSHLSPSRCDYWFRTIRRRKGAPLGWVREVDFEETLRILPDEVDINDNFEGFELSFSVDQYEYCIQVRGDD